VEGRPRMPARAPDVAVPEEVRFEALFGDARGAEVVGLVVRVDRGRNGGCGCHDVYGGYQSIRAELDTLTPQM